MMDGMGFALIMVGVVGFTAGYNVNARLLERLRQRNFAWQAIGDRQARLIEEQHATLVEAKERIADILKTIEAHNA